MSFGLSSGLTSFLQPTPAIERKHGTWVIVIGTGIFHVEAYGNVFAIHVEPLFALYAIDVPEAVGVDSQTAPAQFGCCQTNDDGITAADHVEPPLEEYAAAVLAVVNVAVHVTPLHIGGYH